MRVCGQCGLHGSVYMCFSIVLLFMVNIQLKPWNNIKHWMIMMKCVVLRNRVSAWITTSHWICLISLFNLMCFVHLSLCMRYVGVWLWLFPYLHLSFDHSLVRSLVLSVFIFWCVYMWYVCVCVHCASVCMKCVSMFEATCGPSFRWNFRISHNLNGQRQTTHFSDYDRCFRFRFFERQHTM